MEREAPTGVVQVVIKASSLIVAVCAAAAWFWYVTSLPYRVGLGSTWRDSSTIAIGVGAFLLARLIASSYETKRPLLPPARVAR